MRVVERYSHLNGEEYLLVHKPRLWQEVLAVDKALLKNLIAYYCTTILGAGGSSSPGSEVAA